MVGLNVGGTEVDCNGDAALINEVDIVANLLTAVRTKKVAVVGPCESCT